MRLITKFLIMRLFLFILFSTFAVGFTTAQSVSFNHAYQQFPSVPKGFLEAYAYTHTRMVDRKSVV